MIPSKDNRIFLSPIERDDLSILQSWRNSQAIQKFFREYRLFSMEQKEKWYSSMILDNRFEMFTIKDFSSKEIVGVTGLTYIDWVNRHADLHLYIGKDDKWIDDYYIDASYDTITKYGFGILNLNKIWAEVYEFDKQKIDFFLSKGFNIDASLREHYYYNGAYHTSHILSLLEREHA